jgi:ribosomal protein L10
VVLKDNAFDAVAMLLIASTRRTVQKTCRSTQIRALSLTAFQAPTPADISPAKKKRWPLPVSERAFTPRKKHLYAEYTALTSSNDLHLLLSYADMSPRSLTKLRRQLAETCLPRSPSNPFGIPKGTDVTRLSPKLLVVRCHMLVAALKAQDRWKDGSTNLGSMLRGPVAVLSLPTVDPPHLAAVLKVLDRALPRPSAPAATSASGRGREEELAMPPLGGGGTKKPKEPRVPSLRVVGGLIEGRMIKFEELNRVTSLPSLQVMHSQIVGLLGGPPAQLAGVLGQAAGRHLLRTLDGFRQGLEDAQKPALTDGGGSKSSVV